MSMGERLERLVEQGKEALARAQLAFHAREHELAARTQSEQLPTENGAKQPPVYSVSGRDS